MKITLLLALVLAMSGCATSAVITADATPVPADRILSPAMTQQMPGTGTVVVTRDTGSQGSGCYIRLYTANAAVADLDPGERVTLYLVPGKYILGTQIVGRALCGLNEPHGQATADVTAGSVQVFRMQIGMWGALAIRPSAF